MLGLGELLDLKLLHEIMVKAVGDKPEGFWSEVGTVGDRVLTIVMTIAMNWRFQLQLVNVLGKQQHFFFSKLQLTFLHLLPFLFLFLNNLQNLQQSFLTQTLSPRL